MTSPNARGFGGYIGTPSGRIFGLSAGHFIPHKPGMPRLRHVWRLFYHTRHNNNVQTHKLRPRLQQEALVCSEACYADILDRHNQGLKLQGRKEFLIPKSTIEDPHTDLSRLVWAAFND